MKWITDVKLLALLLFLIAIVHVGGDSTGTTSWDKLQISPKMLCAMPHGNFRVQVYEHSNNFKSTTSQRDKRYFYKPIALLDHRRVVSTFNDVTKEWQMRFEIHMWNEEIEKKVTQHVSKVVGQQVEPHQVEVIYLEKVMLASSKPSSTYSLPSNWMAFQSKKLMWFSISCLQQSECDQLAETMRTSPEQFDHFQLLFSLSAQALQTKETLIRVDSVVKGEMVTSLLQRFENKDEVLLTANDKKKLLAESTRHVIVETFDESPDVISPDVEEKVNKKLENLLISASASIKEQADKRWESVFWNDDNYRPDKASKMMNDVYHKLDKDKQNKLVESFKNYTKGNVSAGAKVFLNLQGDADVSNQGKKSSEDLEKLWQESKAHVEWDGERFIPKPLSLSRINLSQLRDTQSLQEKRVRVSYSTVVLSTPIYFDIVEGKNEKRLFDLMSRTSSSLTEIEALVERGVNINCRNNREMTPLLQLMELSHPNTKDILLLLIKNKVDFNAKDNEGRTALHVLCQNYTNDDIDEIARLLIRNGVDVEANDIHGHTALHSLQQFSKNDTLTATVEILIQQKVEAMATTQMNQKENLNEIVRLIGNGVDVKAKTKDGWTALHFLCQFYQNANLKDIVRVLIKNEVDVNAKKNGLNALHYLCLHYHKNNLKEIIQLLIENKVNVNAKTPSGWTALHFLCQFYRNENIIDIIRLLIQHGVDVNAKDGYGWTAADYIRLNYDKSNRNDTLKLLADEK